MENEIKLAKGILSTQNEGWGFFGTVQMQTKNIEKTEEFWNAASMIITKNADFNPSKTRELLDSRWGRHTADSFYEEINNGTFIERFNAKMDQKTLQDAYYDFVGNNK